MKFQSVLIVVTERCHVGCRHCGYIGKPRDREMTEDELKLWVRQIITYGVPVIIFTGGEPFERYDVLAAGVRTTREAGGSAAVFTSSFWATSREEAVRGLEGLGGLDHIYLSTDMYHKERVPVDNVRHAIEAALGLGMSVRLVISYTKDEDLAAIRQEYTDYASRITVHPQRVIPNRWLDTKIFRNQSRQQPLNPDAYSHTCFLGTPLINPNGDLFACHLGKGRRPGTGDDPYLLGNLRGACFEDVMGDASLRADYQYLRTHGPRGVVEAMDAHQPIVLREAGRSEFTSACDMCTTVLNTTSGAREFRAFAERHLDEIDIRLVLSLHESSAFRARNAAQASAGE